MSAWIANWRWHPSHVQGLRRAVPVMALTLLGLLLAGGLVESVTFPKVPNYLGWHMALETLSITVSVLIFAVGWNSYGLNPQRNVLLLACGLLGVALLDFSHMLSFDGMPAYFTPNSVAKGINFWLPARYLGALTLLLAMWLPWLRHEDPRTRRRWRWGVTLALLALVLAVHWLVLQHGDWLPPTYQNGALTAFKILAEYGVVAIYAVALASLVLSMRERTAFHAPALLAAVWTLALGEIFFTWYVLATDVFNLLGHVYKALGYLFLYRAIFVSTIEAPYKALEESEKDMRAVFAAVPDLMFEVTSEGRYVRVHAHEEHLLVLPPEALIGKTIREVLPPDIVAVAQAALDEARQQGIARNYLYELDLADGRHWFELSVARKATDDPARPHFVVLSRDVTQRTQVMEDLRKLRHAVEQAPNSIFIADAQGRIEYINPAFSATTGYSAAEVLGKNPRLLSAGRTPEQVYKELWASLEAGKAWRGEFLNRRKDGSEYYESASISPLHDDHGVITHYLAVQEDVTHRKQDEERIRQLANFDALTGLPNRTMFASRFTQALGLSQRSGQQLALLYLDLDHFKNINESLGHSRGDELLVEMAKRLQARMRDVDTVSRPGGDEFIIVLPLSDAQRAAHVAEDLLRDVRAMLQVGPHELVVTASIGIAMYPEDGQDYETLSRSADAAMFKAKDLGRDSYRFFSADMQERSLRVLQIENGLRSAIVHGQLVLHYQPQVRLSDGAVTGVEALLRWSHPELGQVSPAEFIPVAEASGQILGIGEWVLRGALAQVRAWREEGLGDVTVAVNLSLAQFRHAGLVDMVRSALAESGVPARMLELELTESIAMDAPERVIGIVAQLWDLGVKLSIDDFGTGYSSFSYIQRLKVHKLKIDQSFVRHLGEDAQGQHIVRAIVALAQSLGLECIAEGVETEVQRSSLATLKCDTGQGYLFCRPVLPGAAAQWMRGRRLVPPESVESV